MNHRNKSTQRFCNLLKAFVFSMFIVVSAVDKPTAASSLDARSASVIMYHRFGDGRFPTTNITIEQFDAHLKELGDGDYTVMALSQIVARLRSGEALPPRTVALTVDDAYTSVYTVAWPKLKQAGFPFTLFVATDAVDQRVGGYMTWDQIREMKADGVEVGSQTASHLHMAASNQSQNERELAQSNARFEAELGEVPTLFAYPYGETSIEVMSLVERAGFQAAFGQHSGVAHPSVGLFYLPRFAMNENFGGLDRFRLAANALPIPVEAVTPADVLITGSNPPNMGFSVNESVAGLDRMACFSSHEGKARVERLGDTRFEVRVTDPFPVGRTRINCTAPGPDGRWHWFGRQYFVK